MLVQPCAFHLVCKTSIWNPRSEKMSERPVPRRHSPWVDEEVYKREVKAHRCNDRVEDVIYVSNQFDQFFILNFNSFLPILLLLEFAPSV